MTIQIIEKAEVDGESWVTIRVPYVVANYLFACKKYNWHRTQPTYMFDVPEKLVTFLQLKYSNKP